MGFWAVKFFWRFCHTEKCLLSRISMPMKPNSIVNEANDFILRTYSFNWMNEVILCPWPNARNSHRTSHLRRHEPPSVMCCHQFQELVIQSIYWLKVFAVFWMPNFLSCFRVKTMKLINSMYLLVNFSIIYVENKWLFLDLMYETERKQKIWEQEG